jgi:hypothetical protein
VRNVQNDFLDRMIQPPFIFNITSILRDAFESRNVSLPTLAETGNLASPEM